MAEDKKEPWLNYMALSTVFFALFATLSTFKGGGFSTLSVISQARASDQWAYYQATSVKAHLYELQRDRLQLDYDVLPANTSDAVRQKYQDAIKKADAGQKKYEQQKQENSTTAKAFEDQRDQAKLHGKPLGYAVILLQVAIVISSVAGLIKKKVLWQVALPLGIAGIAYFINGIFLLF